MYHARDMVAGTKKASDEWSQELSALKNDFKPEWLEYWFDGLGFCVFLSMVNFEGPRTNDSQAHGTLWGND